MGIKRWPKRREFMAYYMLVRYTRNKGWLVNYGEAVDILYVLVGSKRLAGRLVRALVRLGYLERVKPLVYRVKPLDELLTSWLGHYMASRMRRRGIKARFIEPNKIVVEGCLGQDSIEKLEELGFGVEEACSQSSSS